MIVTLLYYLIYGEVRCVDLTCWLLIPFWSVTPGLIVLGMHTMGYIDFVVDATVYTDFCIFRKLSVTIWCQFSL